MCHLPYIEGVKVQILSVNEASIALTCQTAVYYRQQQRKGDAGMDAKRLGAFIAILRKENGLTQRELAERLHVTDKAVSRWERGIGFPDIGTIESLADALGVSILELMQCERLERTDIGQETAAAALDEFSRLAERRWQTESKRNAALYGILFCVFAAVLLVVRQYVSDPFRLLIWLLIAALGIPGLVRLRRTYRGVQGEGAWKGMLLRNIVLAVLIVGGVIILTVWIALNRS